MTVLPSAVPESLLWLQQAPVAMIVLDQQMGYLAASQRWHQLYQVPQPIAPQIPLKTVWTACPNYWYDVHQRVLEGKAQSPVTERLQFARGETGTVRWTVEPWQDATHAIAGSIWVSHLVDPDFAEEDAAIAALSQLVEPSLHFMALLSPTGHILAVNRATLKAAKIQPQTIQDSLLWEMPWWEMTMSARAQLKGAIVKAANGEAVQREITVQQLSAQALDFTFLPIAAADGRVHHLLAEGRNLNAQKSVERALSRSERLFTDALKLAQMGSWEWNILTGEVRWSQETFHIYGLEPESDPFTFDRQISYVHSDDRQRFYTTLYETIYQEQPYKLEFRIVHADGRIRHLHAQGEPIWNEYGEVTHLFGTLMDVSDRKQLELQLRQEKADLTTLVDQYSEQLAENTAEYQAVFEYAGIGLDYIDRQGRIIRANQHCCDLLGYSEAELLKLTLPDLTHTDDVTQDLLCQQELLMGQRDSYSLEKRCIRKDGSVIWVHVHRTAVRDRQGRTQYLIGVIKDTHLAKTTELELRNKAVALEKTLHKLQRTQAQLVQTEKLSSLGQMVAGVAHEINNPVNFIYGNLSHASDYVHELLDLITLYHQQYPLPNAPILEKQDEIDLDFLVEDLPQIFTSMQVGADRIKEIVASLRHFSRMDEAAMKPVDLHDGLNSTLMILQNRLKPKPESPGIVIEKNYGQLPQVECYAGQLNQVFMNILSNAIDALEERDRDRTYQDIEQSPSQIEIQTQIDHHQAIIIFHDNGPGIPADVQPRLFDPFFTTKPVGQGTGLGLAISYQIIVEKHGGQLQCQSAPEEGTTFRIAIPLEQPEPNPYPPK